MAPIHLHIHSTCAVTVFAKRFNFREIVALDVGEHASRDASERITDPRVYFVVYDGGITLPVESDTFDKAYSVLTIQHLDKHYL